MVTKRGKKSTKKVRSLKVKSLSTDRAKHVKGGPINPPWRTQGDGALLLPAVQKVRE